MLNGHLLDELGHLVLQFLDAFLIIGVCWISHSGTNRLEALALLLGDWIRDCFRSNPLTKVGQHLIDAGCGESYIPSSLQWKLKLAFSLFHWVGILSCIRVPTVGVLHSTATGFANDKNRWILTSGAKNM